MSRRNALLLAVAAAPVVHALPTLASVLPALRRPLGIADRIDSADGVALTFDDGPHPDGTPAILRALADGGARATFFLVGEHVERRPALAAEVVAAGHTVGLHCYRHRPAPRLGPLALARDTERGLAAIAGATGRSPGLYRVPMGFHTFSSLAVARRHGLRPLHWTHDPKDWRADSTPDSIVKRSTNGIHAGAVVALHDSDFYGSPDCWRRTAEALPRLLAEIGARGLRPVAA